MKRFLSLPVLSPVLLLSLSLLSMASLAQNVGIGTETPAAKLHIFNDDVGSDLRLDSPFNTYLDINSSSATGVSGIKFIHDGTEKAWMSYSNSTDKLRLTTLSGGEFVMDSDGRVGIGTDNPSSSSKLHVEGNLVVRDGHLLLNSTTGNNSHGIYFQENAAYHAFILYRDDTKRLEIGSDAGTADLAIDSTGKIGIGTYYPDEKLHVEGTIEVDQRIQANDSGGLEFASDDGVVRIMLTDNGDIGIGTTSPGAKLHVEGTIEVDQKIQANDSGGLEFATDEGTTRMWLADNGNVGLGTSSPGSHKLHVTSSNTGAAGSTGYFVNTSSAGIALSIENSSLSSSDNVLLVSTMGTTGNLASFDSYHGSASGWDREFRFTNTGDGRCDGSWVTGGADYAEFFPMADPNDVLGPGDVIAMSDSKGYSVEKARASRNQLVLGVYSTKPAVIGNSCAEEDPEDAALVGLLGVVPTKVCTENGPIRIGDFLATSSNDGVASKATSSGLVIGRAMENYDGIGVGMIKVMVDVGWAEIHPVEEMESLKAEIDELRDMMEEIKRHPVD